MVMLSRRPFLLWSSTLLTAIALLCYHYKYNYANDNYSGVLLDESDAVPELSLAVESVELPVCNRTFLFPLANLHGLTSELSLLLRAYVLSTHASYTFLLSASSWNYGSFTNYFHPFPLPTHCRLPREDIVKRYAAHIGKKGREETWKKFNHVVWARDVDGLDREFVKAFVKNLPVEDGQLVPVEFQEAWNIMSDAVRDVWRVNDEIEGMISDLDERIGKGSFVGVHLRQGDKHFEAPTSPISAYISSALSLPLSSPLEKLVIVSDNPGAAEVFSLDPRLVASVEVVGTEEEGDAKGMELLKKKGGFHETAFNKLPLSSRIALTKLFVRDLTFLARKADGLVVSGSSNVGRLLALLFQRERDHLKSVDTRWYPTARHL